MKTILNLLGIPMTTKHLIAVILLFSACGHESEKVSNKKELTEKEKNTKILLQGCWNSSENDVFSVKGDTLMFELFDQPHKMEYSINNDTLAVLNNFVDKKSLILSLTEDSLIVKEFDNCGNIEKFWKSK